MSHGKRPRSSTDLNGASLVSSMFRDMQHEREGLVRQVSHNAEKSASSAASLSPTRLLAGA